LRPSYRHQGHARLVFQAVEAVFQGLVLRLTRCSRPGTGSSGLLFLFIPGAPGQVFLCRSGFGRRPGRFLGLAAALLVLLFLVLVSLPLLSAVFLQVLVPVFYILAT